MKNKKFYEFKNENSDECELYIYGAITSNKDDDWFPNESDVDLTDFKEVIDNLQDNSTLNIYVNSPGGSVFAASTMASMLQRAKEKKRINIVAYIDGLAASAASFLVMAADDIKLYSNSMLMIHKPMSFAWGNANDLQKEIDTLDSIENNVMIPLYEKKAKCDKETLKALIDAESWLSATEVDDLFNVSLLNETKNCSASIDKNLFKHYKNVPDKLINNLTRTTQIEKPKQQEIVDNKQNIDYSYFENKLKGRR